MSFEPSLGFVTTLGIHYQEALPLAEEFGFDHVEILMNGDADREALRADVDDVTGQLSDFDLDLVVHLPFPLPIGSPFDTVRRAAREEVVANVDLAVDLGATKGVIHPHTEYWPLSHEASDIRSLVISSLNELETITEDQPFALCPENVTSGPFSLDSFQPIFEETDLEMTLDTGHARIAGFDAAELGAFVRDHAGRISHLHLNDTRWDKDEHLPYGAGNYDFERVFAALADTDWSGTVSLEVFTPSTAYLAASKRHLDEHLRLVNRTDVA